MKNLNSLISLINKLNQDELKSLLKYLKYYNEKDTLSKSSELVKIIYYEKEYNSTNIQHNIYKTINDFAFNKLVDRLRSKILEVLMFNTNISKNHYPERVKVIFDLKKKLIQCDILSLKGLRDDGDELCRKIISKAEKYELFDIVISALVIRQRFVNIRKREVEFKNIQNQINYYENKYKSLLNSQLIYNSIINKINNSSDSLNYFDDLKLSIYKISNENSKYKTDIATYYLLLLKTEEYQITERYDLSSDCLKSILDLLSLKSIYSDGRVGSTLLNIANNYLHLSQFDDAIKYAEDSRKYFPNNIFNQALVDECLFYAYYYKNDISMASDVIIKLTKLSHTNNISTSINKWNYFSAIIKFVNNEFDDCIKILNNIDEIGKDKEGWNINKRLLLIMSRIELKQFESVDLEVASLEKFIKRVIKKKEVSVRYILIIRILIKLINSNYNFEHVLEKRRRYIKLLHSRDVRYKWKIKSPELVSFNEWFESKLIK